ncbi:MAG: oxidoreductase [Saprospiraceae bacterium]|nr:oxidoreductase [Candidatus Brachybacter algidus]
MPKWIEAEVIKTISETDRVKRIWINPETDEMITAIPGQFITFDLPVGEKRLQRWKSYSIANYVQEGIIELCVAKMEGGLGSAYLCDEIKVGDKLKFKGPEGVFVLPDTLPYKVVMVCTGTGLAPFLAMLQMALGNAEYDHIDFHLIFGTRYEKDLLYYSDLLEFRKYKNFKLDVALSRYEGDGPFHKGYVHSIYQNTYNNNGPQPLFMLCGWQAMIDEAVGILESQMQIDKKNVMVELYG